jgi:hypothetical protein
VGLAGLPRDFRGGNKHQIKCPAPASLNFNSELTPTLGKNPRPPTSPHSAPH